jgi:cellobiose-specific phosphotransferase system component IIA
MWFYVAMDEIDFCAEKEYFEAIAKVGAAKDKANAAADKVVTLLKQQQRRKVLLEKHKLLLAHAQATLYAHDTYVFVQCIQSILHSKGMTPRVKLLQNLSAHTVRYNPPEKVCRCHNCHTQGNGEACLAQHHRQS